MGCKSLSMVELMTELKANKTDKQILAVKLRTNPNRKEVFNEISATLESERNFMFKNDWWALGDQIRILLEKGEFPGSEETSRLLCAFLTNCPESWQQDLPEIIAAVCFRRTDLLKQEYDLSKCNVSEPCRMLLSLAKGNDPYELREMYRLFGKLQFTNAEIYRNFVLLRLGRLIYRYETIPQSLARSLPGDGWQCIIKANRNLQFIWDHCRPTSYTEDRYCFGWKHGQAMCCTLEALDLIEALYRQGVISNRGMYVRGMFGRFPEEDQKRLAFSLANQFAEVRYPYK